MYQLREGLWSILWWGQSSEKSFFYQFFDDNSQIPEMLTFVKNVSYASFKYLQFCIYTWFSQNWQKGVKFWFLDFLNQFFRYVSWKPSKPLWNAQWKKINHSNINIVQYQGYDIQFKIWFIWWGRGAGRGGLIKIRLWIK